METKISKKPGAANGGTPNATIGDRVAGRSPALPPVPILPVPQTNAGAVPGAPRAPRRGPVLLPGLAASSQAAAAARRNAQAARQGIERAIHALDSTSATLAGLLAHYDANSEALEQWGREGVEVALVRSFQADVVALLAKYTVQPATDTAETATAPDAA